MGGATNTIKRAGLAGVTGGLSEFARQDPFGAQVGNPVANIAKGVLPNWATGYTQPNIGGDGPFRLDPYQMAADKEAILGLGNQQYADTNKFIDSDQAARQASRQQLGQALTKQSGDTFQQMLPGTLEDLNGRHLLNGSGVGQEIARQQGNIATNIADQVGTLGAGDIDTASAMRSAALTGRQGFETGSLQRGLSLEDFINQANVSKSIGQSFAPKAPTGKQNFATTAQGVGALAPFAKLGKGAAAGGPPGAAMAALPLIAGSYADSSNVG